MLILFFLFIGHHFTFSTSIWIWWNALLKFPPPLYSCQTHHLALLKPPLPAKHTDHNTHTHTHTHTKHFILLFMDDQKTWTSHSTHHTVIFTPFIQHTIRAHTHSFTHSLTQSLLWQQGCWVEPKGMQEVQYGWGVGLCNCSLPAPDITDTSLRPTWPVNCPESLSAIVTTVNLWLGMNAVQPIRTGSKNHPRSESMSKGQLCPNWANWLQLGTMVHN